MIIGGTGSLTGSIIGAAFLSALPELMREFSTYRMLAYSVVLVLVMLFRPGGIIWPVGVQPDPRAGKN